MDALSADNAMPSQKERNNNVKPLPSKAKLNAVFMAAVLPVQEQLKAKAKRRETSYKLAELYYLEQLGFSCGLFPAGTERTRGPRPKHLDDAKRNFSHLISLTNEQKKEAILERLRAIVFE